eukprot:1365425-Amorphochlora_amoeboformis.AAC.1
MKERRRQPNNQKRGEAQTKKQQEVEYQAVRQSSTSTHAKLHHTMGHSSHVVAISKGAVQTKKCDKFQNASAACSKNPPDSDPSPNNSPFIPTSHDR